MLLKHMIPVDYFHSPFNLPFLSDGDIITILNILELTEAVKLLTSNKSPGEDDFPPDFL